MATFGTEAPSKLGSMNSHRILLVDDDLHLADALGGWLRELYHQVDIAGDLESAKAKIRQTRYDLVITDLRLGPDDGFSLIGYTKQRHSDTAVLVISGYATPSVAVDAVRAGAFDLLTKPVIDDELQLAIDRALSHSEIEKQNEELRSQLEKRSGLENIISHDYRMLKIFDVVDSVADAKASILITGENGTGKSMIARAIHNRSQRRGNPFVEVACGALPDSLLESELFGHVAGAFTGANNDKIGKFKMADSGTLFLDEIGTATQAMQVKLLRVLQEFQFEQLGGTETHSVDTRVILATNEDLAKSVAEGSFRQDLYYRINVVNIALPALRERGGDIPLLVEHFLADACETCGREIDGFDTDSMNALQAYQWPGNIRQLQNVVERAVLLSRSTVLSTVDLPPEVLNLDPASTPGPATTPDAPVFSVNSPVAQGKSLREQLETPERQIILHTLKLNSWNRAATADALEINRTTLYKKMKRLGLDDPRLQYATTE